MKKFLLILLSLAMVMSMAGAVLAVDPHDPHDPVPTPTPVPPTPVPPTPVPPTPVPPTPVPPTPEEVIVIKSSDVTVDPSLPANSVIVVFDEMSQTSVDLKAKIDALSSDGGFTVGNIVITGGISDDKQYSEVKARTIVPLSVDVDAISADVDKIVITISMEASRFKNPSLALGLLRAHKDGSVVVGTETVTVEKDKWYSRPVVEAAFNAAGDKLNITIHGFRNFFSKADLVIAEATIKDKPVTPGSSGGGCNVGFAPLALLLVAPLFFLKK